MNVHTDAKHELSTIGSIGFEDPEHATQTYSHTHMCTNTQSKPQSHIQTTVTRYSIIIQITVIQRQRKFLCERSVQQWRENS